MAHRDNQADVEDALDRYRELTADEGAQLVREDRESEFRNAFGDKRAKTIARYTVENSEHLRGFEAFGHGAAKWGLNLFCDGIEVERRRAKKTA